MKAIVILGSRNPEGQTAQAAQAFVEGFKTTGGVTEQYFLPPKTIERCRQCEDSGWGLCRSEGRCTIDDEFAGIVDNIRKADSVIFATPVYFSDISESLRAFLDRLRRICQHPSGKIELDGKPAIVICVAGGGGGGAASCVVSFEKILSHCGFDLLDIIPARRQNLDMKLSVLKTTGQWLGTAKL